MQFGQWSLLVLYTYNSILYGYFHSVTKYGIILVGNSSYRGMNFTLQNTIVSTVPVAQPITSCRSVINESSVSACSMPVYTFINELHYLQSGKTLKQVYVYTVLIKE